MQLSPWFEMIKKPRCFAWYKLAETLATAFDKDSKCSTFSIATSLIIHELKCFLTILIFDAARE